MILPILAQIRTVARSGDTIRAWRMLSDAGLLQSDDVEALSLKGRLLKDRAARSDATERSALLAQAQAAYMQAAGVRPATYPLINAATLAFLNGCPDEASRLARAVLALLDNGNHEPETRYWLAATAAEAHLLLGDRTASQAALVRAMEAAPQAWEDHAATLRQFQQILARQGASTAIIDPLRPPPSLYFSGIIGLPENEDAAGRQIGEALDMIGPGAVFGALAAGADILIAELAAARGAALHIVLPTALEAFREASVARFGGRWPRRFDRLMEMAESIDAPQATRELSDAAVAKGSEIAMGLALRRAEAFATHAVALHVGRASDPYIASHRLWHGCGLPLRTVTLAQSTPPQGPPLRTASNKAILASIAPFAPGLQKSASGIHYVILDDPAAAMALGEAILRTSPGYGLALEYRTVLPTEPLDGEDGLALLLAPAAPAGSICMSWPDAAAMALQAPGYRFELAGDVITRQGDCPVGHYFPSSA